MEGRRGRALGLTEGSPDRGMARLGQLRGDEQLLWEDNPVAWLLFPLPCESPARSLQPRALAGGGEGGTDSGEVKAWGPTSLLGKAMFPQGIPPAPDFTCERCSELLPCPLIPPCLPKAGLCVPCSPHPICPRVSN